MIDPIQSAIVGVPGVVGQGAPAPPAQPAGGRDFKSILLDSLNEVNRLQTEADQGVQRLLSGETNNVAEVFTAVNKAGIAFDLLMEVRNKLVEAYQEIQQMRV
jgi:flagellar hook-basal body complex protein FliE